MDKVGKLLKKTKERKKNLGLSLVSRRFRRFYWPFARMALYSIFPYAEKCTIFVNIIDGTYTVLLAGVDIFNSKVNSDLLVFCVA